MTGSGYLAGCIISVFSHEAGHICAAHTLGIRIKQIGIAWRGPYILREIGSPVGNVIVSAAGPLVNLAIVAIAWRHWPNVALTNLVLGLANLVPTPTSDGRRVLEGLFYLCNPDSRAR